MNEIKKIAILILGVIILFHLRQIIEVVKHLCYWFAERLAYIDCLPYETQSAIAYLILIFIVVVIYKAMTNKH